MTTLHERILAVHRAIGGVVKKDSQNTHFRNHYASLLSVINATGPALSAQGLYADEATTVVDGKLFASFRIVDAETGEGTQPSLYPIIPAKTDPQGYGSALTYARRYLRMTVCGLAPADDDGQAASWTHDEEAEARKEAASLYQRLKPLDVEAANAIAADMKNQSITYAEGAARLAAALDAIDRSN